MKRFLSLRGERLAITVERAPSDLPLSISSRWS